MTGTELHMLEGERSAFYGDESEDATDIVARCYDAGYDIMETDPTYWAYGPMKGE